MGLLLNPHQQSLECGLTANFTFVCSYTPIHLRGHMSIVAESYHCAGQHPVNACVNIQALLYQSYPF